MDQISISDGGSNRKLGAIPSVSLYPVKDCAQDVPCAHDCYACRMLFRCSKAWAKNSLLARKHRSVYFGQVRAYLAKQEPRWFRWHVAGDILDQAYLREMVVIAREFPATRFLVFTKRHELDYSNTPRNLSVVFSMWPGWGKVSNPWGFRRAWMDNGSEPRIPSNAISCPGTCDKCGMCWNLRNLRRDVVFEKH